MIKSRFGDLEVEFVESNLQKKFFHLFNNEVLGGTIVEVLIGDSNLKRPLVLVKLSLLGGSEHCLEFVSLDRSVASKLEQIYSQAKEGSLGSEFTYNKPENDRAANLIAEVLFAHLPLTDYITLIKKVSNNSVLRYRKRVADALGLGDVQ